MYFIIFDFKLKFILIYKKKKIYIYSSLNIIQFYVNKNNNSSNNKKNVYYYYYIL